MQRTLKELAQSFEGQLIGDGETLISKVGTIQNASKHAIAFLDSDKYKSFLSSTKASAVITHKGIDLPPGINGIIVDNPKLVFAQISSLFNPLTPPALGVHPSASIDESASIGVECSIGPNCVIEEGVSLGDGVIVGANTVIGAHVSIGDRTRLGPNNTIYHRVVIGADCDIQSGNSIGGDGFGYANERGQWHKVPQVGTVVIGDKVEIGNNNCLDRGTVDDTIIGDGVIMDNLIQVGHNVIIGHHTAVAAACGFAGSTKIGAYCMIGGSSVFNGHIEICDRCMFIPGSQVANTIKQPGVFSSGIPARDRKQWAKNVARFHHLDEMGQKLRKLSKQVETLIKKEESISE